MPDNTDVNAIIEALAKGLGPSAGTRAGAAAEDLADLGKIAEEEKHEAECKGRREFLFRLTGLTTAGLFVSILGSGRAAADEDAAETVTRVTNLPPKGYNWEEHLYAYLIDTTKCIGCGMCVRACKNENGVPDGFYRTWVEQYLIALEEGDYDVQVSSPKGGLYGFPPVASHLAVKKGLFVPKMCNHCDEIAVHTGLPGGASYQTKDGVVLVDQDRCIGCGYCIQACPYGSRFLNPETHTADKCTWCYHRITKGLRPACVAACPTGTRLFGDLKRSDDPVLIALGDTRVQVLQPDLLTRPRCYYIGLDMEVR